MIAVLQRVSEASVRVDGAVIGQIGAGLLVLLCAEKGDTDAVADKMLAKILKLRIFGDEAGKMNLSVQDVGGGLAGGKPVHPRCRCGGRQPPQLHSGGRTR